MLRSHRAVSACALGVLVLAGCVSHDLQSSKPEPQICCAPRPWAQGDKGQVDLLFVVDNSQSMADEQAQLKAQFVALMAELRRSPSGLPDLHLGVTSTDLGVGMYSITYCEERGGDAGQLLTGSCPNPTGTPYLVDVEPEGCDIQRTADATGTCSAHACSQAHCAHEPSTSFVQDPVTGCPRCRNYSGETLETAFSCMASLGVQGCGFEQPLEAMYKALDTANTANIGFLRETAVLAVVLITDEDDCSATDPVLFDPSPGTIDSTYGPLTSFRCFEHGITCDENSRLFEGWRTGCAPREDNAALLHPLSRYIQFLQALKDPDYLVVSAIAGPVLAGGVETTLDASGYPQLAFSCDTARGGAVPGVRLRAFLEAFHPPDDLGWAHTSICSDSYVGALSGVGRKVREVVDAQCPLSPLYNCADVAVEYGQPGDGQDCNDICAAECDVTEVRQRGTELEESVTLPACLEVCSGGPCPGNRDRDAAYAGGHPELRDPALPVEACWHVRYQPLCERSGYGEIVVARQADPAPRSFVTSVCRMLSVREQQCADNVDDDGDCLVDLDDPDCWD